MPWGRRCSLGCESWPDQVLYARCPECGEPTRRIRNLHPLSVDEAISLKAHKEFELHYARHCLRLGIPVEGPLEELPEAL